MNTTRRLRARTGRGLTLQLFLVVVLPLIILVLLVTFGSLQLHHEAMRALVADRNLRTVQSAAENLSKEIQHRGDMLELLARQVDPPEQIEDAFFSVAEELSIFEGGVAAVGSAGKISAFVGNESIRELASSSAWAGVLSAIQPAEPGVAQYLPIQRVGGQLYVPVWVNVSATGSLVGLFSAEKLLSDGLRTVSENGPVTVVVVDKNLQILYQSGKPVPDDILPSYPGLQHALSGNSDVDYLQTAEGEHLITTSAIQPMGWALLSEELWEDIASPLLRLTQNAPLIIVPILGLTLLALWFGLRRIVQPMQALERKAGDLARGNFETIRQPVGGVPEIGHLQDTLIDMAAQLKEAENSLHSYIGAITDSVESERRNLARELHDETLQSLIALGQYTQYAIHWNKDPAVEKTLVQMTQQVEQGMKNLRRLVQGLRPIYIEDLGLATALAMQTTAEYDEDEIRFHFQMEGGERRLKPEAEIALYRMAQEIIQNIRRHSNAENAWVLLRFLPDSVILEIRDDGQGFVPPPDVFHYARLGHYGLLGLHERAELIGATLTIHSSPGEGTCVQVKLADDTASGDKSEGQAGKDE